MSRSHAILSSTTAGSTCLTVLTCQCAAATDKQATQHGTAADRPSCIITIAMNDVISDVSERTVLLLLLLLLIMIMMLLMRVMITCCKATSTSMKCTSVSTSSTRTDMVFSLSASIDNYKENTAYSVPKVI